MKQFIYCSVLYLFTVANIFSQNSLDDLNIIFQHDFEKNTVGDYRYNEWKTDFLSPEWCNRQSTLDIVQNSSDYVNNSKAMQINFPANSLGPEEGGTNWWTLFPKQDELYMSYDFQFMPGFQFQRGGKLPSFQAGTLSSNGPTGYDGFTGGLMFNKSGNPVFYIYYPDNKWENNGESFLWGTTSYPADWFSPSSVVYEYGTGNIPYCDPGKWHNITYRMVANTVSSEGHGNYDGLLEAYFDGVLVTQVSHLLFRHTASLGMDHIRMVAFFGGDNDSWRNPIEEWLRIDNIMLFTFKSGFNVPRGNNLSPRNRTINYWRNIINESTTLPNTPSGLYSANISKTTASIKWTDNSNNEYGFDIYRSLSPSANFTKVGSTPANATEYISSSLSPNTTYYYKILAFNGKGNSELSPVLSLTTLTLQVPAAPSAVKSTNPDLKKILVEWTDNSNNEDGFLLEKSESDNEHFVLLSNISSNQISFEDNRVISSKNYYRIRAFNSDGISKYSDTLAVEFQIDSLPDAPSKLNILSVGYDKTLLKWTDNSPNEAGFEIERHGPDNNGLVSYFSVAPNDSIFTDTRLSMNSEYVYYVRSFNTRGYSGYSNKVTIKTLYLDPPVAPTALKTVEVTQSTITIEWEDNSNNEAAFYVKRSLASDANNFKLMALDANITKYVDQDLSSGTNYLYAVFASNIAGNSPVSNQAIGLTLSESENMRIKDGLIAYYNFTYDPDYIVRDVSNNQYPINLHTQNHESVQWHGNNSLKLNSGAYLISSNPAEKIISSLKSSNEIAVECWIKPSETAINTESRVISLSDRYENIGFTLNQNYSVIDNEPVFNYGVRLHTASTSENGYPEFKLSEDVKFINLLHLVYTKDSLCNEKLYFNGVLKSESYRSGGLNIWSDNYFLSLGNSPDNNLPWAGTFYTVAFYNKALTDSQILKNYAAGPSDNLVVYNNEYNIQISPNPITDFATIDIIPTEIQDIASEAVFRIIDMFGNKYYEEVLFNPGETYTKYMDFQNYPKGIYLIQVISNKKQQTTKFILE